MTYVLIHGAASDSWSWHLTAAELRARGHEVITPDLPCEDDSAGLGEYADVVIDTIGDRTDLVVVAHSFGGFTAPLVCDRIPVDRLVLVTAMIPAPGEPPGAWWGNTGWKQPPDDTDPFCHDLPRSAAEPGRRGQEKRARPVRDPFRGSVAARRLAAGTYFVPAVPGRPFPPCRVHARPGAGPPGNGSRRDRRRPSGGAQPSRRTRGPG